MLGLSLLSIAFPPSRPHGTRYAKVFARSARTGFSHHFHYYANEKKIATRMPHLAFWRVSRIAVDLRKAAGGSLASGCIKSGQKPVPAPEQGTSSADQSQREASRSIRSRQVAVQIDASNKQSTPSRMSGQKFDIPYMLTLHPLEQESLSFHTSLPSCSNAKRVTK